jgi:hypothetical protein
MTIHRFIGDHETPTPLTKVQTKRPILGTGKIPDELIPMMQFRTFYLETNPKEQP